MEGVSHSEARIFQAEETCAIFKGGKEIGIIQEQQKNKKHCTKTKPKKKELYEIKQDSSPAMHVIMGNGLEVGVIETFYIGVCRAVIELFFCFNIFFSC